MRNRQHSFRIEYRYGEGDLYEIVSELTRDAVLKAGGPSAVRSRTKKMSDRVQAALQTIRKAV
jgi:hypothetical protein